MSSTNFVLNAQPDRITLDAARSAVIVVDMQNDFGSPGGLFDRGGVDISMIRKAVEPTRKVLAAGRNAGMKIVYLKMGFRADLSDLGAEDSVNRTRHLHFGVGQPTTSPDGSPGRFLVRDTWNTAILDELAPEPGDVELYKHRFSGFYETELDRILRERGIRDLVFTGCTTCVCVDSTLRDAMFRDYRCVLLADCSGEPIGGDKSRSNHEAALLTVQTLLGWVSDSESFLAAVKAYAGSAARAS